MKAPYCAVFLPLLCVSASQLVPPKCRPILPITTSAVSSTSSSTTSETTSVSTTTTSSTLTSATTSSTTESSSSPTSSSSSSSSDISTSSSSSESSTVTTTTSSSTTTTTTTTTVSSCTSTAPTTRAFPTSSTPFLATTFYLGATYIDSYPCDYTPDEEARFQQSFGRYALNELVTGRSTPYDFLYFSQTTESTASRYTINANGWILDASTGKIATSLTGQTSQFVYWDLPENIDYSGGQIPATCAIGLDGIVSCNVDGMNQFSICFSGTPTKDYGKLFLTKSPRGQGSRCRGVTIQAIAAPSLPSTTTTTTTTTDVSTTDTTTTTATTTTTDTTTTTTTSTAPVVS